MFAGRVQRFELLLQTFAIRVQRVAGRADLPLFASRRLFSTIYGTDQLNPWDMQNLQVFFINHFDTDRLSDDRIRKFSEDHIQRLAGAPAYSALLAAMQ